MGEVKRHSCRRGTDVQHGDVPLQFVMSGLVEEIAQPDHASGLTREIRGKSRRTAAEHAGYRVQFLAASAQVVTGYDEVGSAKCSACRKQHAILAVPKSMARLSWQRHGLDGLHHRSRLHRGLHRLRLKQRGGDFL
jgi:hypothetical protein